MASIKISESLLSKSKKTNQELEAQINKLKVTSYYALKESIGNLDEDLHNCIFDNDVAIKRNVFLVYNNSILERDAISSMEFEKDGMIEIMLQFGGG